MKFSLISHMIITAILACSLWPGAGQTPENADPVATPYQESPQTPEAPESPEATTAEYPNHSGFPVYLDYWVDQSPATIADLDGDGSKELIVTTYNSGSGVPGKLYVLDHSGRMRSGFPVSASGAFVKAPAVGDLDRDGRLEIVAGVSAYSSGAAPQVMVWRADGSAQPGWPRSTNCYRSDYDCGVASVALGDMNRDSYLDVIAATDNRDLSSENPALATPNLYVWSRNAQPLSGSWPLEDDHNVAILAPVAVGDLDGDTYLDIAFGRDYNRLFAHSHTGASLQGWPVYVWAPYDRNNWNDDQIEFSRSAVTLVDLNQDGRLEYLASGLRRKAQSATYETTQLLAYSANGQRAPGWDLPASGGNILNHGLSWAMIEAPAIGDLTGDGLPEIVLASQDGMVRAYSFTKQLLWSYNYAQGRMIYSTETVIGDVDGDGRNEVVFGTFDPTYAFSGPSLGVTVLDHTGQAQAGMPLRVANPGTTGAPALDDWDGDGLLEIAAVDHRGTVYVWDTAGAATPRNMPWPMARHDLQRTGHYVSLAPDYSNSSITANRPFPNPGERVTFTVRLLQSGSAVDETLAMTAAIPIGMQYVPESLQATSGSVNATQPNQLRWSGSLFSNSEVVITYQAEIGAGVQGGLTTQVTISGSITGLFTRSITVLVSGNEVFLPFVRR